MSMIKTRKHLSLVYHQLAEPNLYTKAGGCNFNRHSRRRGDAQKSSEIFTRRPNLHCSNRGSRPPCQPRRHGKMNKSVHVLECTDSRSIESWSTLLFKQSIWNLICPKMIFLLPRSKFIIWLFCGIYLFKFIYNSKCESIYCLEWH